MQKKFSLPLVLIEMLQNTHKNVVMYYLNVYMTEQKNSWKAEIGYLQQKLFIQLKTTLTQNNVALIFGTLNVQRSILEEQKLNLLRF